MKPSIGVVFGGVSVEHEVSIISGIQTLHAIDSVNYRAVPLYIAKDGKWYIGEKLKDIERFKNIPSLLSCCTSVIPYGDTGQLVLYRHEPSRFRDNLLEKIDVAFPVLHGTNGEDGTFQGLMEMFNVPYVGSGVQASVIGMDKLQTKVVLKNHGLPVVDYIGVSFNDWYKQKESILKKIVEKFNYPVIVKPTNLGSSIGIGFADTDVELKEAIENSWQYTSTVLIESLISNLLELNCSVLGNRDESKISAIEEPLRSSEILDFKDKYQNGNKKGICATGRILPANISKFIEDDIKRMAYEAFQSIDANGIVRIDFLVNRDNNEIYVNEINTIPGSLAFYLWEPVGVSFPELTDKLIDLALEKYREKNKFVYVFESNLFSLSNSYGKLGAKCS